MYMYMYRSAWLAVVSGGVDDSTPICIADVGGGGGVGGLNTP
jgi:hypothetical protein